MHNSHCTRGIRVHAVAQRRSYSARQFLYCSSSSLVLGLLHVSQKCVHVGSPRFHAASRAVSQYLHLPPRGCCNLSTFFQYPGMYSVRPSWEYCDPPHSSQVSLRQTGAAGGGGGGGLHVLELCAESTAEFGATAAGIWVGGEGSGR